MYFTLSILSLLLFARLSDQDFVQEEQIVDRTRDKEYPSPSKSPRPLMNSQTYYSSQANPVDIPLRQALRGKDM